MQIGQHLSTVFSFLDRFRAKVLPVEVRAEKAEKVKNTLRREAVRARQHGLNRESAEQVPPDLQPQPLAEEPRRARSKQLSASLFRSIDQQAPKPPTRWPWSAADSDRADRDPILILKQPATQRRV